jgi:hypothetical protein
LGLDRGDLGFEQVAGNTRESSSDVVAASARFTVDGARLRSTQPTTFGWRRSLT